MPKLSIIIPVYNSLPYLERTVESVLAQTFRDFELILVDDGSTDGSGALCEELAERDSRVRVIHQENQGLSGAWATGVDNAKGEFIGFSDSDDYILPHMYDRMLSVLFESQSDIVRCGYLSITAERAPFPLPDTEQGYEELWQDEWRKRGISSAVFDRLSFMRAMLENKTNHALWQTVFRSDLLTSLSVERDVRRSADYFFWLRLFESKQSFTVRTIPDCLYIYLKRPGSVSNNQTLLVSSLRVHNRGLLICRENGFAEAYKIAYRTIAKACMGGIDLSALSPVEEGFRKEILGILRKSPFAYLLAKGEPFILKSGLVVLCISPRAYIYFGSLYKRLHGK